MERNTVSPQVKYQLIKPMKSSTGSYRSQTFDLFVSFSVDTSKIDPAQNLKTPLSFYFLLPPDSSSHISGRIGPTEIFAGFPNENNYTSVQFLQSKATL